MWNRIKAEWPRLFFLSILVFSVIASAAALKQDGGRRKSALGESLSHTLVIDPGHGGFDGGAVSDDGTKESDINLAIAGKAALIAQLIGQETVMTRSGDSARTDFSSYSEHEELVYRTSLINSIPGAVAISIHQNDFPTGQPSGAQVLYSSFAGSKALGLLTHENLVRSLDPENRRVAEPAPKGLYMPAHVTCPMILVECGFMSNNFEVLKLNDASYQSSIALILIASLLQFQQSTDIT